MTRPAELVRALEVPVARAFDARQRMVFPAPSVAYATTVMNSAFAFVNTAFSSAIVLRRKDMSSPWRSTPRRRPGVGEVRRAARRARVQTGPRVDVPAGVVRDAEREQVARRRRRL